MVDRKNSSESQVAELIDCIGRLAHFLQFAEGLNPAQWGALRFLARANRYSQTPGALACFLRTSRGTTSQTLRVLESKGYVRRIPDRRDRRVVQLELTPAGAALLDHDPMLCIQEAAASLSGEMESDLAGGLSRILNAVQKRCGLDEFGVCWECGHFLANDAADDRAGPHRCGLTGDPLGEVETRKLCVNTIPITPQA